MFFAENTVFMYSINDIISDIIKKKGLGNMCERYEEELLKEFDLIRAYQDFTRDQICELPEIEQRQLCHQIRELQMQLDWNAINRDRYSNTPSSDAPGVQPSAPKLPPQPRPFRSWHECWIFWNTKAAGAPYEPQDAKVEYTVTCTYQPDWRSGINPRVVFDAKGVIATNDEARKFKSVQEQCGIRVIFVFQRRDIELPYQKPRKDGTRQTQEEWCEANGFAYTYAEDYNRFIESEEYKQILAQT